MMCAWDAYIAILPIWMRDEVDKYGAKSLQELRLRVGCFPELILFSCRMHLDRIVTENDIQFIINAASKYSPWTSNTLRNGYITAAGGHRIGVCGMYAMECGQAMVMQTAHMLCLRVARDFSNISTGINMQDRSVLIIGRPGCGKTTLLRDLIRRESQRGKGSVGVVDERCEIFPIAHGMHCFDPGGNTDVLSGVEKKHGIEMLLRCMNPEVIAVDEITSKSDCDAVLEAGWCGVRLFATAHAGNVEELYRRPIYKPLVTSGLFNLLVCIQPDKSWKIEGMTAKCFA